jgi:hypothetical protein
VRPGAAPDAFPDGGWGTDALAAAASARAWADALGGAGAGAGTGAGIALGGVDAAAVGSFAWPPFDGSSAVRINATIAINIETPTTPTTIARRR